MEVKTCTQCWCTKPLSDFYKGRGKCKDCIGKNMSEYYKKNKSWLSVNKKKRYAENKDEINKWRREKYAEDKEIFLKRASDYYARNREDVLRRAKINIEKRKEKDFITFKLRRIYAGIKHRCNNPNDKCYNRYWWRWIKCLRKTFEDFYNDMHVSYEEHYNEYWEKNTQIDRIDNDWHYCKENCRWVTVKENNPHNHAKEFNS